MKVRVGHLEFSVRDMSPEEMERETVLGLCFRTTNAILLRPTQGDTEFNSTLVHELLHAIHHAYSIPEKGLTEEQICLRLEGPFVALIRDNPRFIGALAAAAQAGRRVALEEPEPWPGA